jgi:hypothetical protein
MSSRSRGASRRAACALLSILLRGVPALLIDRQYVAFTGDEAVVETLSTACGLTLGQQMTGRAGL